MKNNTHPKGKTKPELRMYSLVLYQLSGVQAGIQNSHSMIEYSEQNQDCATYKDWAKNHKTVMLMNGGTSEMLNGYAEILESFGVKYAEFREPDLGNLITSVSFIVDASKLNQRAPSVTPSKQCFYTFVANLDFHGGK